MTSCNLMLLWTRLGSSEIELKKKNFDWFTSFLEKYIIILFHTGNYFEIDFKRRWLISKGYWPVFVSFAHVKQFGFFSDYAPISVQLLIFWLCVIKNNDISLFFCITDVSPHCSSLHFYLVIKPVFESGMTNVFLLLFLSTMHY